MSFASGALTAVRDKILITGASGLLGQYLCSHLSRQGNEIAGFWRNHEILAGDISKIHIDLLDFVRVEDEIIRFAPTHVIHCAGLTDVDECERNEELAEKLHVNLSKIVAESAQKVKSRMIHISTDHLWDGTKAMVTEETPLSPVNAYGRTKGKAEEAVLRTAPNSLVIRTNFFGDGLPWRHSFSDWVHKKLLKKELINAFSDVYYTPISLFHLAKMIESLIARSAQGVFHVAGADRVSKYEAAIALARHYGYPAKTITPVLAEAVPLVARRPRDMSLNTSKCSGFLKMPMPDLSSGIKTLTGACMTT